MFAAWKRETFILETKLLDQRFVTDTTHQLHKVTLLSNTKSYLSRDSLDLAPGVFATIALVSVAPGQVSGASAAGNVEFLFVSLDDEPYRVQVLATDERITCAINADNNPYNLDVSIVAQKDRSKFSCHCYAG